MNIWKYIASVMEDDLTMKKENARRKADLLMSHHAKQRSYEASKPNWRTRDVIQRKFR